MNHRILIIFGIMAGTVTSVLDAKDVTELDCLVKPEMYIDLSSPVDGVLESVLVEKSDYVEIGQELAKLESSIELARLHLAEQQAAIYNKIKEKKIRYEFAKRKKKRVGELYKKKAISFQDQDEAETEVALARSDLTQARLDRMKAQLELELAKAELNRKTITSPINGIVIERYVLPGESVNDRPILQLAKVDPLLVEVVAPAELFGLIKSNMKVEIRPEAPANSSYQATVNVVDRIIDAASGSFSVRLALPNPDDNLIGGTKCIARFNLKPPVSVVDNTPPERGLPDNIEALLSGQ